jgi:hypothetical protein
VACAGVAGAAARVLIDGVKRSCECDRGGRGWGAPEGWARASVRGRVFMAPRRGGLPLCAVGLGCRSADRPALWIEA